jgi:hypothetical protein
MGAYGGDVDHGAFCALLFDLGREGVAAEEDALDVDAHDLVEFFFGNQIGAL